MPGRVRLFDFRPVADAGPRAGEGLPEPPQDGGPLMAWGKPLGEERAAQEAALVAQERAAMRSRMSPFEQQNLAVLAEIRDALTAIAAALTPPRGEGSSTSGPVDDQPESATPQVDSAQPAGGCDDSAPTGGAIEAPAFMLTPRMPIASPRRCMGTMSAAYAVEAVGLKPVENP